MNICLLFYFFLYTPVRAEKIESPINLESIGELINQVSGITAPLAALGFIAMVIYAGFVRMTAAGNPEKEAKGMKIAVSAAIGFAIIALAPLLVRVIGNILGVREDILS